MTLSTARFGHTGQQADLDQAIEVFREGVGVVTASPRWRVAAIAARDPARAVELLEAGWSMLWTQALHLRQDLAALQERTPGLAAVLEISRAVLRACFTTV